LKPSTALAIQAQIRSAKERTIVWHELKRITQFFAENDLRVFVRAGTWLSAYRQAGYTPFDRDNDFGILDSDVPSLKALRLPDPYTVVWLSETSWRIQPFVEGWPLMDCVVYTTNVSEQVAIDGSWGKKKRVALDLLDLQFFDELEFYDGVLRAPANSTKYLKHMYGTNCLEVQVNKCARGEGSLYKTNPKKCNSACYSGALDFPHIMQHPNFTRGAILGY